MSSCMSQNHASQELQSQHLAVHGVNGVGITTCLPLLYRSHTDPYESFDTCNSAMPALDTHHL